MKIKHQNEEYLDSKITNVFHFLELQSSHAFLVGSSNIRNIKYAVDYDLNENLKLNDTIKVLDHLYNEFLSIFKKAYENENYYVVDFKCGYENDEPIRWAFSDLKNGYVYIGKIKYTFQQCLIMPDNIIKLDLVYVYNGIFTDINILYNFHIVQKKRHLKEVKENTVTNVISSLKGDIDELIEEHHYFKALKRMFALSNFQKRTDKKLLALFNSDYGMLYKFINSLDLIVVMMEQEFKSAPEQLIISNLEYIKQFGSHITIDHVNIDPILDELLKICKSKRLNKNTVAKKLTVLIEECQKLLNSEVKKLISPTA